jgi:hypothetical protein
VRKSVSETGDYKQARALLSCAFSIFAPYSHKRKKSRFGLDKLTDVNPEESQVRSPQNGLSSKRSLSQEKFVIPTGAAASQSEATAKWRDLLVPARP